MKNKKKLSLKKMSIAQLDTVKGGNHGDFPVGTYPTYTGLPYVGTEGCNTGMQCQYTQTPTSMLYCVNQEN